MKENIIEAFKKQKDILDLFKSRIVNILQDLLSQEKIIVHQITSRTKDVDSLSKKIDRKQGKYENLNEITDLVGIRIISYLESDVDLISALVSKEFNIDSENSIDKRLLKIDQFGYKSLHVVASLNKQRYTLTEYSAYKDLKCEIQIRSILQHAWAEIEHDIGYKGKISLPDNAIRSFNRLSALLETADLEFDRLKKELNEYESSVDNLIKTEPQDVSINQASLISFINTNPIIKNLEEKIYETTKAIFYNFQDFESIIKRFELFEIKSIKELETVLSKNQNNLIKFSYNILNRSHYEKLPSSITIFHLQHFLACKTQDLNFVLKYFKYSHPEIAGGKRQAKQLIDKYLEAIK